MKYLLNLDDKRQFVYLGIVNMVAGIFCLGSSLVKDQTVWTKSPPCPFVDALEVSITLSWMSVKSIFATRANEFNLPKGRHWSL